MTSYQAISLDILQDLMEPILGEILVESLFKEKLLRERYGSISNPKSINGGVQPSSRMEIIDNKLVFQGSDLASSNGSNGNSLNGTPGVSSGTNGNSSNNNSNSNGFYFQCSNCDRKIAGSRFAAHIDKCLGGRTRK